RGRGATGGAEYSVDSRTGSGAGTRALASTGAGPRDKTTLPESLLPARSGAETWAGAPHTGQTGSRCADSDDEVADKSNWWPCGQVKWRDTERPSQPVEWR